MHDELAVRALYGGAAYGGALMSAKGRRRRHVSGHIFLMCQRDRKLGRGRRIFYRQSDIGLDDDRDNGTARGSYGHHVCAHVSQSKPDGPRRMQCANIKADHRTARQSKECCLWGVVEGRMDNQRYAVVCRIESADARLHYAKREQQKRQRCCDDLTSHAQHYGGTDMPNNWRWYKSGVDHDSRGQQHVDGSDVGLIDY